MPKLGEKSSKNTVVKIYGFDENENEFSVNATVTEEMELDIGGDGREFNTSTGEPLEIDFDFFEKNDTGLDEAILKELIYIEIEDQYFDDMNEPTIEVEITEPKIERAKNFVSIESLRKEIKKSIREVTTPLAGIMMKKHKKNKNYVKLVEKMLKKSDNIKDFTDNVKNILDGDNELSTSVMKEYTDEAKNPNIKSVLGNNVKRGAQITEHMKNVRRINAEMKEARRQESTSKNPAPGK